MYRITNINTGANLGAVDKVVYIKLVRAGISPLPPRMRLSVWL